MSPGRDLDIDGAIQRRNGDVGAENSFPGSDRHFRDEVLAFDFEIGVFGQADAEEKIASGSATNPTVTPAMRSAANVRAS